MDEHPAHESVHVSPVRRLATSVGLIALAASAFVGSNLFGVRDSLFGSATPAPAVAAGSRVAGGTTATTMPNPTRLRSQPWWQAVTTLEGSGPTTSTPFTIDDDAIQWRVKWTCQAGHLLVEAPQSKKPLVDGACPGGKEGKEGFATKTGSVRMKVAADGPWKLEVEQQVDVPLVEEPLPAMTAPGAAAISRGSFYNIDQRATGRVTVYRLADGSHALRLDDFFVSQNAELEVRMSPLKSPKSTDEYLAAPSEVVTYLDVTTGSLNFVIPSEIDPEDYGSIVIWCQLVRSAYAAATLEPVQ